MNRSEIDGGAASASGFESATSTIAFVDLAGFSAITDVFGDASAVAILGLFEDKVRVALGALSSPIKWIGDEAMLAFPGPEAALQVLGRLLPACRAEPRLPLTRAGLNHGPVLRRANDYFGATVNIASRLADLAAPGQLLATRSVADVAVAQGIVVRDLGDVALRSVAAPVPHFDIEIAAAPDPAWIDPVCKMHAPYEAFRRTPPTGPWFCSGRCAEAYRRSPATYPLA